MRERADFGPTTRHLPPRANRVACNIQRRHSLIFACSIAVTTNPPNDDRRQYKQPGSSKPTEDRLSRPYRRIVLQNSTRV
jgi:hypothetical protein